MCSQFQEYCSHQEQMNLYYSFWPWLGNLQKNKGKRFQLMLCLNRYIYLQKYHFLVFPKLNLFQFLASHICTKKEDIPLRSWRWPESCISCYPPVWKIEVFEGSDIFRLLRGALEWERWKYLVLTSGSQQRALWKGAQRSPKESGIK